jgi:hypothetical protein
MSDLAGLVCPEIGGNICLRFYLPNLECMLPYKLPLQKGLEGFAQENRQATVSQGQASLVG